VLSKTGFFKAFPAAMRAFFGLTKPSYLRHIAGFCKFHKLPKDHIHIEMNKKDFIIQCVYFLTKSVPRDLQTKLKVSSHPLSSSLCAIHKKEKKNVFDPSWGYALVVVSVVVFFAFLLQSLFKPVYIYRFGMTTDI
jgi:hypothetical protein